MYKKVDNTDEVYDALKRLWAILTEVPSEPRLKLLDNHCQALVDEGVCTPQIIWRALIRLVNNNA